LDESNLLFYLFIYLVVLRTKTQQRPAHADVIRFMVYASSVCLVLAAISGPLSLLLFHEDIKW
jgi:hypothetical protein